MTIDDFWAIVERVHVASGGDMDTKCKLLADELRQLPAEKVRAFGRHFRDLYYSAYSRPLWDAAALICGGCGDDSFMDFRSTLISMGKSTYQNAVSDPDSLADTDMKERSACYEGYQYVVSEVYEEKGEKNEDDGISNPHPREPSGQFANEWELSRHFPRLAAKFHHDDSKYLYLKEKHNLDERRRQFAEHLANLWLEGELISANGLIPPLRVLKRVMRTGRSPLPTGKKTTWKPFELNEEDYWPAVMLLERMPADQIKAKSFTIDKLAPEMDRAYHFPNQWALGLVERNDLITGRQRRRSSVEGAC
ncbi:MAG: DUF4240 domain-containing protein [Verrucomicrobia bacterium]|nr:DUF4240 domain-containing protein [Verrucomicrobiota bacterium]